MKFFVFDTIRDGKPQFSYWIRLSHVLTVLDEPDLLTIVLRGGECVEIHNPDPEDISRFHNVLQLENS